LCIDAATVFEFDDEMRANLRDVKDGRIALVLLRNRAQMLRAPIYGRVAQGNLTPGLPQIRA
jgi:hypothetical protein